MSANDRCSILKGLSLSNIFIPTVLLVFLIGGEFSGTNIQIAREWNSVFSPVSYFLFHGVVRSPGADV